MDTQNPIVDDATPVVVDETTAPEVVVDEVVTEAEAPVVAEEEVTA